MDQLAIDFFIHRFSAWPACSFWAFQSVLFRLRLGLQVVTFHRTLSHDDSLEGFFSSYSIIKPSLIPSQGYLSLRSFAPLLIGSS